MCRLEVVLTIAILGTVLGTNKFQQQNERIIGGTIAERGEFPFMIALFSAPPGTDGFGNFDCAATLISRGWMLTSTDCINRWDEPQGKRKTAIAGRNFIFNISGEIAYQDRGISGYVVHPNYDAATGENNVALIQLSYPFSLDNLVATGVLPSDNEETAEGESCIVPGWGYTTTEGQFPSTMMKAPVNVISDQTCSTFYPPELPVLDSMICAGSGTVQSRSICLWDEGSPLLCNGTIVGVGTAKGACTEYPTYTQVSRFRSWIRTITTV